MLQKSKFNCADDAFSFYLNAIRHSSSAYSFANTNAVFNQSFTIIKPENNLISHHERKWSHKYAEREWQWYLTGDRDVTQIKKHAPIWDTMHNGDNKVWSNYGWWWKLNSQYDKIVKMLIDNKETRRAVIVHYDPTLLDSFGNDTPCNIVLNFYIFAGRLNLTIFARSIDLWFGFCNDQYCFSMLMQEMTKLIGVEIGDMHWFITNFHLYKNKL